MSTGILTVNSQTVTVISSTGQPKTIFVRRTPKTNRLTQSTQKRLLATGFMIHIDPSGADDGELIRSVMRHILSLVQASDNGGAA